jgi:N-acetylmuramoyl-L-alanine amidase
MAGELKLTIKIGNFRQRHQPNTMPSLVLKLGSTGTEVRQLQARLSVHGLTVTPNSTFDGETEGAVKTFQKRIGAPQDGRVWLDPRGNTWPLLLANPGFDAPVRKGKRICLDPGHGYANRKPGANDTGAVGGGVAEAAVVLQWAKILGTLLEAKGHTVSYTRQDASTPTSITSRTERARVAKADLLLSLHCNAADGTANGTETFYRQSSSKVIAERVNNALVKAMGTKDRGVKTEKDSQHSSIHVLSYKPDSILVEIGFVDNAQDRSKMTDVAMIKKACQAIADVI